MAPGADATTLLDLGGWLAVAGVFVLAGTVKGVVGLGLPTVAIALLAVRMPPAEAVALLLVPSLLTNLQQAATPCRGAVAVWRGTAWLHLGIVVGTLAGGLAWGVPSGRFAPALLGGVLLLYALVGVCGLRAPPLPRWALPAGACTGVLTALTGVFVLPAVPWLQSLALPRERLVQAMGIAFTCATVALGFNLWRADALPASRLFASLGLVLPAVAGMRLGARLRAQMPEAMFRRGLFVALGLLGAWQLLQFR